jgi:hypothetical protein
LVDLPVAGRSIDISAPPKASKGLFPIRRREALSCFGYIFPSISHGVQDFSFLDVLTNFGLNTQLSYEEDLDCPKRSEVGIEIP